MHRPPPKLTIDETVLKKSDNLDKLGVILDFSTLTGSAAEEASISIRVEHFRADINVYAISNFLPSSFGSRLLIFTSNCLKSILHMNLYFKSIIF